MSLPLNLNDVLVLGSGAISAAIIITAALRKRHGKALLIVESNVDGAEVVIDDSIAGKVPFRIAITPGKHRVVVSAPGYEPYETEVYLEPHTTKRLFAELFREIRCSVEGIEVEAEIAHPNDSIPVYLRLRNYMDTPVTIVLKPSLSVGATYVELPPIRTVGNVGVDVKRLLVTVPPWIHTGRYTLNISVEASLLSAEKGREIARYSKELLILEPAVSVVQRTVGRPILATITPKRRLKQLLEKEVVLDNKYRVVGVVGEGAFSITLMAYDESGTVYALKIPKSIEIMMQLYRGELLPEETVRVSKSFFREIEVFEKVSKTNHPHIVRFYGTIHSIPGLVLEYCEGGSLRDLMDSYGKLEPRTAITVSLQIADALLAAYGVGLKAHRDLKPSNILFTRDGIAKLTDFNIAKIMESVSKGPSLAGTEGYAAPEQFDSSLGEVSEKSDVFALALITYEMITGKNPLIEIMKEEHRYTEACAKIRVSHEEIEGLIHHRTGAKILYDILSRALSLKPDSRPSMNEFRNTLADALQLIE